MRYIVTYTIYDYDNGLYTEAVSYDNEADAENRFNEYIANDVLSSFDGTAEEFDKERDRLLQCVTAHPSDRNSKVLNVEIDDSTYCVCLIRQS